MGSSNLFLQFVQFQSPVIWCAVAEWPTWDGPPPERKPSMNPISPTPQKALRSHKKPEDGLECWFWAGWEPLRHYRRMGKSGSPFFGKGAWLAEWGERKFSDELINMAVKMGATVLITEFFKGFGRKVEVESWPRLKDFVSRCHQRGLKVWGYAQARSLYYETLAAEVEDWESWTAKTHEGKRQIFAKSYYRCAPCLTSPDYADYMAAAITDGVAEIGFDGIHLDNSYYEHCWCSRCADRFRRSLEERSDFEDLVGIPFSRHIQPPPLPPKGGVGLDALQILWLQFGVDVRIDFFSKLRKHLKVKHPGLTVAGNPAFPRSDTAMISRCVTPAREAEAFDFLCCENGNLPRVDDGWISSQTEAHLLAEAGGYKIWVTSWREAEGGVAPPKPPGGIWASLAEEYSFGRMLGNNWAFRPAGDGGRFFAEEEPEMAEAFRDAMTFFQRAESELRPGIRRTHSDVAVLHDPLSASLGGEGEIRLNLALHQYLLREGIPFHIVLPGQPLPEEVRLLVVFHVGALSDRTLADIKTFAAQPDCRVWLAGHSAQNDEWFTPRNRSDLTALRSVPGVQYTTAFGGTWQEAHGHPVAAGSGRDVGYFARKSLSLGGTDTVVFDGFFGGSFFQPAVRFGRPAHVLVHSQRTEDGRRLFHFRDQSGSGERIEGVEIRWIREFLNVAGGQVITPESDPVEIPFFVRGRERIVALPPFRHYALVAFPDC